MLQVRACIAASALVAALAVAAPAAAQNNDWSGFYLGGTVGASWSDTSIGTTATAGGGPIVAPTIFLGEITRVGSADDDTGFTGSLEAGLDWQGGSWLVGIETDIGFFDTGQTRTNTFSTGLTPASSATVTSKLETDWLWTVRPRLGFVSGDWLFFGSAGLAMSRIKYSATYTDTRTPPGSGAGSVEETNTGWAGGLGVAYAWGPGWSVKGEWLYVDLGDIDADASTPDGFIDLNSSAEVKANLIRVGVDYRF